MHIASLSQLLVDQVGCCKLQVVFKVVAVSFSDASACSFWDRVLVICV